MQRLIQYISFLLLFFFFQGCSLDRIEIKENQIFDIDTTYIFNQFGRAFDKQEKTGFLQLEDNRLISALSSNNEIYILNFSRKSTSSRILNLENIRINYSVDNISRIISADNNFYLLVQREERSDILMLDNDFSIRSFIDNDAIKSFIDTTYNRIDKFTAEDITYDSLGNQLLVSGKIESFGEDLSFAMGLDLDLKPLWFNAYFFAASGKQITVLPHNHYLILGEREGRTHLISDNNKKEYSYRNGLKDFQYYDYFNQSMIDRNSIFITAGTSEKIKIGKYLFNEETIKTEKVNIWPSISKSSRPSPVILGHNDELVFTYINNSENKLIIEELNGKWKNAFPLNSPDDIPLGIIKANHIGYYILILQKENNGYYPRIIKTDDVGQTCKSLYGKNCDYL